MNSIFYDGGIIPIIGMGIVTLAFMIYTIILIEEKDRLIYMLDKDYRKWKEKKNV